MSAENRVTWHRKLEELFAHTGEKCHCLYWLHKKSEELYSLRTTWIDLPVIIMGTLNGAISVGSDSLFGTAQYASVGVGIVALITAILTTIGSYFAWAKRAEGHRIASLNYDKLYRFITIELSLPREERVAPSDFLKMLKTEYDRLAEISPLIPPRIIREFKERFSAAKYNDISKPEITNGLHAIEIFDPQTATPAGFKPHTLLTPVRRDIEVDTNVIVRSPDTGENRLGSRQIHTRDSSPSGRTRAGSAESSKVGDSHLPLEEASSASAADHL